MHRLGITLAATTLALSAPATALANASTGYRGNAQIEVLYKGNLNASPAVCHQGAPGKTPTVVEVQADVRYAKSGTWHRRGGAQVLIQKRNTYGTWVTVAHGTTSWDDSDSPGWGHLTKDFHSDVTTPAKRWFRIVVPATATFKAVTTKAVQAQVFCGDD